MGLLTSAVGTVVGLVSGFMNFFTDIFLTPPLKATLKHLEETELQTLSGGKSGTVSVSFYPLLGFKELLFSRSAVLPSGLVFHSETRTLKAKSLWDESGAVIMAVRRPG